MSNLAMVEKMLEKRPNLPKDRVKWELHDGIITLMSPGTLGHTNVASSIYWALKNHLGKGKCKVFMENLIVNLSKDEIFIPDVAVVCDQSILKEKGAFGAPDLIVEVLSPSTAQNDRGRKKNVYGSHGVKEYWIVDPKNFAVEVYLLDKGRLELDAIYTIYPKWQEEDMSEEEKAEKLLYTFSPSIFGDLTVSLHEIFEDVLPGDY